MAEWLAAALLALGLLQVLNPNVPDLVTGIEGYRRSMFQLLALFVGVQVAVSREVSLKLVRAIAIASIPILLYGIKQIVALSAFDAALMESNTAALDTWRIGGITRAFSIFNGPFHLGIFAGVIFWLYIASYIEFRRRSYLVFATLAIVACAVSLTRSSILAMVLSIPIVLLYIASRRRLRMLVSFVFALLILMVGINLASKRIPVLQQLLDSTASYDALTESDRVLTRLDDYDAGLSLVYSHPLGLGMGSASDAMGPRFTPSGRIHLTSHNLFLRIALETGWIGISIFGGLMLILLLTARTLKQNGETSLAVMLLGPLVVILIAGTTGSTIGAYPVNLLFWSCSGIAAGAASRLKVDRSDD